MQDGQRQHEGCDSFEDAAFADRDAEHAPVELVGERGPERTDQQGRECEVRTHRPAPERDQQQRTESVSDHAPGEQNRVEELLVVDERDPDRPDAHEEDHESRGPHRAAGKLEPEVVSE